jgi:hypothetical protein
VAAPPPQEHDPIAVLSAVWVLACNDDNPLLTYRGILHRLELPSGYPIRELVARRPELFRRSTPAERVEEWKAEVLSGERTMPPWLKDDPPEEQRRFISSLGPGDMFRSQFRPRKGDKQSSLEVITWGLEHIDRLRKAGLDAREQRQKTWSSIVIPLTSAALSALVAVTSVLSGNRSQARALDNQLQLTRLQVTSQPKQQGYTAFMRHLRSAYTAAAGGDTAVSARALDDLQSDFLGIEPFLSEADRDRLGAALHAFGRFCRSLASHPSVDAGSEFEKRQAFFHDQLWQALFGPGATAGR